MLVLILFYFQRQCCADPELGPLRPAPASPRPQCVPVHGGGVRAYWACADGEQWAARQEGEAWPRRQSGRSLRQGGGQVVTIETRIVTSV